MPPLAEPPPAAGEAPPAPPPAQPPYAYGPPPPWGYAPPPPYGYMPPTPQTRTEGLAIAALVLSIASFLLIGPGVVMAIVALALCPQAKRAIEASGGALTGEGIVTAATVIAWVNVGLVVLVVVGFLVLFTIFASWGGGEGLYLLAAGALG